MKTRFQNTLNEIKESRTPAVEIRNAIPKQKTAIKKWAVQKNGVTIQTGNKEDMKLNFANLLERARKYATIDCSGMPRIYRFGKNKFQFTHRFNNNQIVFVLREITIYQ